MYVFLYNTIKLSIQPKHSISYKVAFNSPHYEAVDKTTKKPSIVNDHVSKIQVLHRFTEEEYEARNTNKYSLT